MKVLVAYFTQTGNTEKIAKAIQEEASKTHEVHLKKIEEIKPEICSDYDVVFLGSPIFARNLPAPVSNFGCSLPKSPNFRFAGFVTHFSPAYSKEDFESGMNSFGAVSKDKGIDYRGCFECQGVLAEPLHAMVKKSKKLSDEEFEAMMAEGAKHPSPEDMEKAKEFARNVLA